MAAVGLTNWFDRGNGRSADRRWDQVNGLGGGTISRVVTVAVGWLGEWSLVGGGVFGGGVFLEVMHSDGAIFGDVLFLGVVLVAGIVSA